MEHLSSTMPARQFVEDAIVVIDDVISAPWGTAMKTGYRCLTVLIILAVLIVTCGCVLQTPKQIPDNSTTKNSTLPISPGTTGLQPDSTAARSADGQNASDNAIDENIKRMQIQGIAPPCGDIQRNCDVPGPVPAETYTQAELIAVNTVPVEVARHLAQIALADLTGGNTSGKNDRCVNATVTGDLITIYDINGMKLYYRFSVGNGKAGCPIFVKANKLLGTPLFVIRSDPDILDNLTQQTLTAEKTVQVDHQDYRIVSSRLVFYNNTHEGIQFVMVNPETNENVQPVLDLCTFSDVTHNATSYVPLVSDNEYISRMGEYQHLLSDWEVENLTIRESVSP
ncbi:MAG: hypothetical protein WCX22_00435 [Methanoregula sp.]